MKRALVVVAAMAACGSAQAIGIGVKAGTLGVGWGNVAGTGVNFYADLGVMFSGTPKATLSANCAGLTAGQCTTLSSQLTTEQDRLQEELKRWKAYPVLNIGITIGF